MRTYIRDRISGRVRETVIEEHARWTRAEFDHLATEGCAYCNGLGWVAKVKPAGRPNFFKRTYRTVACKCTWRGIFRTCLARYRQIRQNPPDFKTSYELFGSGVRVYGHKAEEFAADFEIVGKRSLADVDREVFRLHFVMGLDYKVCCKRLGIDRGNFFHAVYRSEQILGRVFSELEPYALFPLAGYFGLSAPPNYNHSAYKKESLLGDVYGDKQLPVCEGWIKYARSRIRKRRSAMAA